MDTDTHRPLLITYGCSWTFGVGVGYQPGMSKDEYLKICWDKDICDANGFRGLLAKKYNLDTLNFSMGGSSNQCQFRLAKKFLSSTEGLTQIKTRPLVIVLHGITSTARNEMFLSDYNRLVNFKYDDEKYEEYNRCILQYFYDHNNEVARLTEEINFLNCVYKELRVKNLWFDTFNHHEYTNDIDNFVGWNSPNRDLLSTMASHTGLDEIDNAYHMSSWKVDSNKVEHLIKQGYLNPISTHPTKQGHELIANILDKEIEKICQKHNTI